MSTVTERPLSLARVDFADLYARHLCRHSQFGVNVNHLVALALVWFGGYALLYWLVPVVWLPVGLAAAYWASVAPNLPARVAAALAAYLAAFVAAVVFIPPLPAWLVWVYPLLVPVGYKLQAWGHKVYTAAADMTDFNARYPKGPALFWVLLFYEVPFLLNYLVFDRRRWA